MSNSVLTFPVIVNCEVIGKVYKSSHGVWVAQPAWASYSCSFKTPEEATLELVFHHAKQNKHVEEAQYIQ